LIISWLQGFSWVIWVTQGEILLPLHHVCT